MAWWALVSQLWFSPTMFAGSIPVHVTLLKYFKGQIMNGKRAIKKSEANNPVKKSSRIRKEKENNSDWLLNAECERCGRCYCDCENKY